MSSLWVGDKVRWLNNGEIGSFEGIHQNGFAEIKIKGKINLIPAHELEIYEEKNVEPDILELIEEPKRITSKVVSKTKVRDEIDLHIQVLEPMHAGSHPALILEIQTTALQQFVQNSIAEKKQTITIIHGKGEGKLKEYVHHYLDTLPYTKWKILKNRDGATEVWFEYLDR